MKLLQKIKQFLGFYNKYTLKNVNMHGTNELVVYGKELLETSVSDSMRNTWTRYQFILTTTGVTLLYYHVMCSYGETSKIFLIDRDHFDCDDMLDLYGERNKLPMPMLNDLIRKAKMKEIELILGG